jgi:hypothetical protein
MTSNHHNRYQHKDHGEPEGPPDIAAAGDVTTTGHSTQEAPGHAYTGATAAHPHDHDLHDAHVTHAAHGGHTDDATDVSTLVPTTWKQLIIPALILLVVGILVAGPVMNAFAPRPPAPPAEQRTEGGEGEHGTTPGQIGTPVPGAAEEAHPTPTVAASPTAPATTPTAGGQRALDPNAAVTATVVAILGESGVVSRAPVRLEFAGTAFDVQPGNNLLPDWQPPQDTQTATWIEGTYANHLLYIPYSSENEKLFQSAKQGDQIKLVMNTGQTFVFAVSRSLRAYNGPPNEEGQFTVTSAMAQDHAGVTLFLIGDPAPDRAVIQAEFTGTIQ